jgi:hypothetical protein
VFDEGFKRESNRDFRSRSVKRFISGAFAATI